MKKRLVYLILPVITLILEIIPYGAVLYFGVGTGNGGTTVRELFSYFDLIPFGYANFAPMITGIFTCIAVLFLIRYWISGKKKVAIIARKLFLVTAVINLCPIFYGVRYLSFVGILVSVSLVAEAGLLTIGKTYEE